MTSMLLALLGAPATPCTFDAKTPCKVSCASGTFDLSSFKAQEPPMQGYYHYADTPDELRQLMADQDDQLGSGRASRPD